MEERIKIIGTAIFQIWNDANNEMLNSEYDDAQTILEQLNERGYDVVKISPQSIVSSNGTLQKKKIKKKRVVAVCPKCGKDWFVQNHQKTRTKCLWCNHDWAN